MVRSSLTSLSPPWAPTGVAAHHSGPEAARTAPKAGEVARGGQYNSSSYQQEPSQTQLAKKAGLYHNHFIYSDKTYNCRGNCSWLEN